VSNMKLWDSVVKTDPKYTKRFSRGGGFTGTATNATWLAREATRRFGPCGIGWGREVVDEQYREGAPGDVVHVVRIKLWYVLDGVRGEIEGYGQTTFVGKNKHGAFTDEEAPKKSLTDATAKCLSLLGFAADIHLGMFDDDKYVNDRQAEAGASDVPDAERAAAVAQVEAKIKARAVASEWLDRFTAIAGHEEALEFIHEITPAWDAMEATNRKRVWDGCMRHVKANRVDGLNEAGLRDAWKDYAEAHRAQVAHKAAGAKREETT
jgi:hypothetical protein